MTRQPTDGLWSTALEERASDPATETRSDRVVQEEFTDRELTLLWRRSKWFRRHRTYDND